MLASLASISAAASLARASAAATPRGPIDPRRLHHEPLSQTDAGGERAPSGRDAAGLSGARVRVQQQRVPLLPAPPPLQRDPAEGVVSSEPRRRGGRAQPEPVAVVPVRILLPQQEPQERARQDLQPVQEHLAADQLLEAP
jgi:hypothetical protein